MTRVGGGSGCRADSGKVEARSNAGHCGCRCTHKARRVLDTFQRVGAGKLRASVELLVRLAAAVEDDCSIPFVVKRRCFSKYAFDPPRVLSITRAFMTQLNTSRPAEMNHME